MLALRLRKTTVARDLWLGVLVVLILAGWAADAQGATHMIVVTSDPPEGGTVFGAGPYETGEHVTLTALPNHGFNFVAWSEGGEDISLSPILEFTADRDRALVARFRPSLEFVGIAGSAQGRLTLLPTVALGVSRVEIRPRFLFGTAPWDLRFVTALVGGEWRDAQVHFTGSWKKLRFGGGILFNPASLAYRSAYFMTSGQWDDLRLGLRVTHYPSAGSPPAPSLLYTLTVSMPNISVTWRGEDRDGLMFKDVSVTVFSMPLCCGVEAQGTLSFTKQGFSHVRMALAHLPFLCCGLTLDAAITFTVDGKTVELFPRGFPFCDPCLTVYGDILWDRDTFRWEGFALYGYKIRCCFGFCCPEGAGGYLEFMTALDPSRVPGGFLGEEFEYVKFGACGPACCGGNYTLEGTIYFAPHGSLFGISRALVEGGVPIVPGLTASLGLSADAVGGAKALSVGWNWRF